MDTNKGKDMKSVTRRYENITYPPFFPENMSDHFEKIRNMEIRADDIFLTSYPRSGTHWTIEVVKMLTSGRAEYHEDGRREDLLDCSPPSSFKNLDSPRLIISHLQYKYLPRDVTKCRVLYVSRNPKDVAVSLYNVLINSKYPGAIKDWEPFLHDFIEGECLCGSWFDHVRGYYDHARETDNIQIINYEDLKRDLKTGVKQIANFLNVPHDEQLISDIAEACDFKPLKANRDANISEEIKTMSKTGDNIHYRKGQVGDWKNWFTVAQNEQIDQIYEEKMKNNGLKFDYSLT